MTTDTATIEATEVVTEIRQGGVIEGRYRLDEELGRGGFAVTWRGTELATGRAVAVKVLSLRAVDHWKAVEAFEREARILKSIDHPAIPKYIELIAPKTADSDVFVMVQELAPGRSLSQRLKAGWRPNERDIKNVAERILGALEYLHSLVPPLVHRDIKPGNILLDDSGRVSLIDFGSVRDRLARESELGSIAGTFGYMAPEQLSGQARPQSDLYSLGVTLVELATRHAPAELPQRELKIDFKGLTNLSSGMTAWLDRLVEPMPEKRFASARDALESLYKGGIKPKSLQSLQTEELVAIVDEDALTVDIASKPRVISTLIGAGALGLAGSRAAEILNSGFDVGTFILLLIFVALALPFLRRGLGSFAKTSVRLDADGAQVAKRFGPIKYGSVRMPASDEPTLVGNRRHRDLMLKTKFGSKRIAKNLERNAILAVEARAKQQRGEP